MNYNTRLKELRIDHDKTQEEIAEIVNCSRKQIIRYENGEQEITISKLRAICMYFNVSADYILGLPKNLDWPR